MALVIGAPEIAENPLVIENPLLVEDRYNASIPFLCEYFTNGKNAAAAQALVNFGRKHAHLMLGAARIAQQVQTHCGIPASVEFSYCRATRARFEEKVAASKLLLISTTLTSTWWFTERIAAHAKSVNPGIIVIAGGMRVFKAYKLFLKQKETGDLRINGTPLFCPQSFQSSVDYLIVSLYGEKSAIKLINSLLKGDASWMGIPNVAWYSTDIGNFTLTSIEEEEPNDCEVDWSAIPVPAYPIPWYPVQVGQGCPFKCSFCDYAAVAPHVTRCSADSIFRTISSVPPWKDGFRRILFTNDNLLINRTVAKEFLTELIKRDLHVVWKAFIRADTVQDEEIADLMQKSGCRLVFIGVESCEQTVLSNMSKHTTVEMIRKCLTLLLERSVLVRAALVVGFPGETRETVEATVNFFNTLPVVGALEVQPVTLVLSPLSPLSEPAQRSQFGVVGMWSKWRHSTMSCLDAECWLAKMPAMLLPHLSVPYETDSLLEDVASVSSDARRNVYRIRNELHRQQNTEDTEAISRLWKELEDAVLAMVSSTTSPSILTPATPPSTAAHADTTPAVPTTTSTPSNPSPLPLPTSTTPTPTPAPTVSTSDVTSATQVPVPAQPIAEPSVTATPTTNTNNS
ncbi:radical SAM protein [Pelomyxa schiedti]|nr:radical SAM protein [Pelomyxa schiedti]